MKTELLYMKNMEQTECSAKIIAIQKNEIGVTVILDQTVFYPQGGGQPYDTGVIKTSDGVVVFQVQQVRYIDDTVHHIGILEQGDISVGMEMLCFVDKEKRILHSRLHSAGHVIDMALKELQILWIPGKGYHFPEGSYVEYAGDMENISIDTLLSELEQTCNAIISRDIKTTLVFDDTKLQNGKSMRTVFYGDFCIPCGGTHVAYLNEIISIKIRKIKKEKEAIRISYAVGVL